MSSCVDRPVQVVNPSCREDIKDKLDTKVPIRSEASDKAEIICQFSLPVSSGKQEDSGALSNKRGFLQMIKDGKASYFPVSVHSYEISSSACADYEQKKILHTVSFENQPERPKFYRIGFFTATDSSFGLNAEELKKLLEKEGDSCEETNTNLSVIFFESVLAMLGSYIPLGPKKKGSHLVYIRFNREDNIPLLGLNYYVSSDDLRSLLKTSSHSSDIFLARGVANYSIPSGNLKCHSVRAR